MSTAQIRFFTLWRREVNRFMKIKKQTIGAPLLETFLYISVFGAALGSRIKELHGFEYILFVIPGLIMMALATNSFANNASSILQQKFQGAIHDQLSSPASPLELLLAFSLGGFARGVLVSALTFIVASVLVGLPGRTRPGPDPGAVFGRLLLLPARRPDRRPRRAVRRCRDRPDLRAARR